MALACAFVTKPLLDLPTTEALIGRLCNDTRLGRLGGFALSKKLPDAATFSRAFAEFASAGLSERVRATMIDVYLGEQLVGHLSRDSTEIVAREARGGQAGSGVEASQARWLAAAGRVPPQGAHAHRAAVAGDRAARNDR